MLKMAEGTKIDPDPQMWPIMVEKTMMENYRFMLPYFKGFELLQADAAKGAGFGRILLQGGKQAVFIVVVIKDFRLLPLDVMQTADGFYPNTERRLAEIFGGTATLSGVVEPIRSPSNKSGPNIRNETMPPPEAMYGNRDTGYGMVSYSSTSVFDGAALVKCSSRSLAQKYFAYIKEGMTYPEAQSRIHAEETEQKKLGPQLSMMNPGIVKIQPRTNFIDRAKYPMQEGMTTFGPSLTSVDNSAAEKPSDQQSRSVDEGGMS